MSEGESSKKEVRRQKMKIREYPTRGDNMREEIIVIQWQKEFHLM